MMGNDNLEFQGYWRQRTGIFHLDFELCTLLEVRNTVDNIIGLHLHILTHTTTNILSAVNFIGEQLACTSHAIFFVFT